MIHALAATKAYSDTRRGMLTRRCPRCGHEQLTAEEKLFEAVPCAKCAIPVPPMSRRVNKPGGQKSRRRGLIGVAGAVALVSVLLYREQTALPYVVSTLAMCGLLLVVAFSGLEGRGKEMMEVAGQDETVTSGGGEMTTAAPTRPERRVARRKRREAA